MGDGACTRRIDPGEIVNDDKHWMYCGRLGRSYRTTQLSRWPAAGIRDPYERLQVSHRVARTILTGRAAIELLEPSTLTNPAAISFASTAAGSISVK